MDDPVGSVVDGDRQTTLVVQGYNLGDDEAGQLRNRAENESGVRIPYELAEQIADMVNARRG